MTFNGTYPQPTDAAILRDQLESLIGHAADVRHADEFCGCSDCIRYSRVRAELFAIFNEPAPAIVAIPTSTFAAYAALSMEASQ